MKKDFRAVAVMPVVLCGVCGQAVFGNHKCKTINVPQIGKRGWGR